MDNAKFFASLRARNSGVFGTSLSQSQVDGINALLDSCRRNSVVGSHHVANVLAQVYRETGGYMLGVKETVYPSSKDKNPTDAQVIARLDAAWKKGRLGNVRTPYWRDGAFGRGPIQLTHWENYEKFGKELGVPLREKPELALDPKIGADIAVIGMSRGLFRGKKLSDYQFPYALDAKPASNPRRIVNGNDGSDKEVARFHRAFHAALLAGGYSAVEAVKAARPPDNPASAPKPAPSSPPDTQPAPVKPAGPLAGILAGIAAIAAVALTWFFGG